MYTSSGKIKLFFAVNALASIGLNIGVIGVNWFIIDVTKQNSVLGLYGALSLISAFLTLAWGSSITDRYNKIAILKYCCLGQAAIFAITGLLYALHLPALYIIYGLSILNMPLIVIFTTVSRGAIPTLWEKDQLAQGNSALEITIQSGAMLAALLTGILYKYFGFSMLIFAGAGLTVAAGLLLVFSNLSFDYALPQKKSFWTELRQGFDYLLEHKNIFLYGFVVFIPTIVISVANTVIPGYVDQTLGKGPIVYSIADICFAIGALSAGFLAPSFARYLQTEKASFLLSSIALLFMSILLFTRQTGLFFFCIFITGTALAGLRILLNTSFMQYVQNHFLGRVLSLLMALSIAIQAVLCFFIGKVMDSFGASVGYVPLLCFLLISSAFLFNKSKQK